MEKDREGLYSPATTSAIVRILPWMLCELRRLNNSDDDAAEEDPYALMALDIKDAYLCVPQEQPMMARVKGFENRRMRFLKLLPGQRDGAAKWNKYMMQFLSDRMPVELCAVCPAVFKADKNPGLIHVDDLLVLARKSWLMGYLVPELKKEFTIAFEMMVKAGDTLSFLKREHVLVDFGVHHGIVIRPPAAYAQKMADVLGVRK